MMNTAALIHLSVSHISSKWAHFSKVPIIILQALFFHFQLGASSSCLCLLHVYDEDHGFNSFETKITCTKPSVNETC